MDRWAYSVTTKPDGTKVLELRDPRPAWVRRMAEQRAQKGLVAIKITLA